MIGKVNNSLVPHNYIRHNHYDDRHPEKKILINKNTGAVINVRNTNADFRTVRRELSLFREVKSNAMLRTVARIQSHLSQKARFSSLGWAVTLVHNSSEIEEGKTKEQSDNICNKNPRNTSVKFQHDPAINQRGQEFIKQLPDVPTCIDASLYATGLNVGDDLKQGTLVGNILEIFNGTWIIHFKEMDKRPKDQ